MDPTFITTLIYHESLKRRYVESKWNPGIGRRKLYSWVIERPCSCSWRHLHRPLVGVMRPRLSLPISPDAFSNSAAAGLWCQRYWYSDNGDSVQVITLYPCGFAVMVTAYVALHGDGSVRRASRHGQPAFSVHSYKTCFDGQMAA